jgi:hypothetical protein
MSDVFLPITKFIDEKELQYIIRTNWLYAELIVPCKNVNIYKYNFSIFYKIYKNNTYLISLDFNNIISAFDEKFNNEILLYLFSNISNKYTYGEDYQDYIDNRAITFIE